MHAAYSTLIHSYGWDEKTRDLDIAFHSGGTWRYAGVERERFLDFLRSASKGKYFLNYIKGRYAEEKRA
jgi:putative intracellular protease/amidase